MSNDELTFPEHLHVEWNRKRKRLLIDGEPLGLYTADGYHVSVTRDGTPAVTLTLVAKRVTVDNNPFMTDE